MSNETPQFVPACRVDATPEQLQREADRAVLYGACLLVVRPDTRIKPHLQEAVAALAPAVRAYYTGADPALAAHAVAYADACGGRMFLDQKAVLFRERAGTILGVTQLSVVATFLELYLVERTSASYYILYKGFQLRNSYDLKNCPP